MVGSKSFMSEFCAWAVSENIVLGKFQRRYEWEGKRILTLMETIKKANTPKFIGTVYTFPDNMGSRYIVDSQQRFVTICATLRAIHDINSNSITEKFYQMIIPKVLFQKDNVRKEFKNTIINGDRKSNTPIAKAYKVISEYVSKFSEKELETFCYNLTYNIRIISLECETLEEAYDTFYSVNGYAKPVSPKYSILNTIFYRLKTEVLSEQERLVFEDDIHNIIESADNKFMTRFLYHYTEKIHKDQNVLNEFNKYAENKDIKSIVNDFVTFFECDCRGMRKRKNSEIIPTNSISIVYNDIYGKFANNFTEEQKKTLFNKFETITMRSIMTGQNHQDDDAYENKVAGIVKKMNNGKTMEEAFNTSDSWSNTQRSIQYYAPDSVFKDVFKKYNIYKSKLFKNYVLLKMESSLSKGETFNVANLSIEHIMPQNKNKKNPKLNTIGNLTLTDVSCNAKMKDSPFVDKKKTYNESVFALNKYFTDINKWDDEEIETRSEVLANMAVKIWSI